MPRPVRVKRQTTRSAVPRFALYGEMEAAHSAGVGAAGEALHVEPIQSRSQRYRWEIDRHTHAARYQVVWLARGPVQVELDENRSVHDGPVTIVIPPGVVHAFRFSAASHGHVLTLRPDVWLDDSGLASGAMRLFEQPRVVPWAAGSPEVERFAGLCEQLMAECAAPDVAETPVPVWLARSVLWRLAQAAAWQAEPRAQTRHRQTLIARFQSLVEQHFLARWSMARYADALGLSAERLNRLAQAEAGCSALTLVHRRLAREACRRLTNSALPVAQLADALGFEDAAYFSRFFRRHTGMSPRQWREQQTRR